MNEIAVRDQQKWIADHGGDLEGYRRNYAAALRVAAEDRDAFPEEYPVHWNASEQADAIYYADINHLRRLQGHPTFLIEHDEAVRILGEGYFD